MGILPATAQRDLEIMGQLAMCEDDEQNVRKIISNKLTFFDEKFGSWSGLARKTAAHYGLPNPLQYMMNPWQPDMWRAHSANYWNNKMKSELKHDD